MPANLSPVITATELKELTDSGNPVIVDVSNSPNARENYKNRHISGAIYVDVNTQLSDIKENPANGGRHPLPDLQEFLRTLASIGISPDSHVILYDDNNGANAAARFWWMLRSIGHAKVQLLDSGLSGAKAAGIPIKSGVEALPETSLITVDDWQLPLTNMQEVESVSGSEDFIVIDVRSKPRYNGETEPIDLVAGHIPGAINIPFAENLDGNGQFLPADQLKSKYQQALQSVNPENVIVYCGSGVTACHTLLAMDYAGLPIPRLYVGSWSEWSRNGKVIG